MERRLLVLTDGREVSNLHDGQSHLDFECGLLPDTATFLDRLHGAGLLVPGSLTGVTVTLVGIRPDPVPGNRCWVTLARHSRIVELWRAVVLATGANVEIQPNHLTAF